MRLFAILSAGVIAAAAPPLAAGAQMHHERVVTRTVVHAERHGGRTRQVCSVTYRHHHRVRTCRTVRY